jgi:hypothetical protein
LITHGGASRVLHFEPVGRASRAITEPVTRHVELGDIRLHVGAEFLEPVSIELDVGGPFDKEGAINIILATYSTLTEKYAEAHLKRGGTPSAVYDAKIEKN